MAPDRQHGRALAGRAGRGPPGRAGGHPGGDGGGPPVPAQPSDAAGGDLVSRTSTARFACPGLALVERLAPGTIEPTLLRALEPSLTGRMRRVLEAIVAADMGVLTYRSLDDKLMWARGTRELLLGVSELLWPSDEGIPVGVARLYWRRLRAWSQRRVGLRARRA